MHKTHVVSVLKVVHVTITCASPLFLSSSFPYFNLPLLPWLPVQFYISFSPRVSYKCSPILPSFIFSSFLPSFPSSSLYFIPFHYLLFLTRTHVKFLYFPPFINIFIILPHFLPVLSRRYIPCSLHLIPNYLRPWVYRMKGGLEQS